MTPEKIQEITGMESPPEAKWTVITRLLGDDLFDENDQQRPEKEFDRLMRDRRMRSCLGYRSCTGSMVHTML
jgi:hypothetical protein